MTAAWLNVGWTFITRSTKMSEETLPPHGSNDRKPINATTTNQSGGLIKSTRRLCGWLIQGGCENTRTPTSPGADKAVINLSGPQTSDTTIQISTTPPTPAMTHSHDNCLLIVRAEDWVRGWRNSRALHIPLHPHFRLQTSTSSSVTRPEQEWPGWSSKGGWPLRLFSCETITNFLPGIFSFNYINLDITADTSIRQHPLK